MNNNFNNEATNNNSNSNFGGITMMNGTIKTMDVFATTVKVAVMQEAPWYHTSYYFYLFFFCYTISYYYFYKQYY